MNATHSAVEHDGLLDTSTVVSLGTLDPSTLPVFPAISTITLAELSVGPLVANSDQERAARQINLQQVEASFDPLPLDAAAAREFGLVAAALRARGRKPAARAYDALIAAVALSRNLPVYTLNPTAFEGINGLDVRVPAPPAA